MPRLPLFLMVFVVACSPAVSGTFSDVEVVRPDIEIPGAPSATLSTVTFSFAMDSTNLGANANPTAQQKIRALDLERLSLTAKSGITDLSFIQTLHAIACIPINKTSTQSARQVEIADYVRTSDKPVGTTFQVPIPEPIDLLPLLRPNSTEPRRILVIVNLGGQLPTVAWKTDLQMSLALEISQ